MRYALSTYLLGNRTYLMSEGRSRMDLQVSITRDGRVLSTERLDNPRTGDVLASIGRQIDDLKRQAQSPLEPYQVDVRHA
jgi:hypothetical protein